MGDEQSMLGALIMAASKRSSAVGFTLIELLVVMVLMSILIALVAPSFTDTIALQRLRGAHDQLATDVQFTRTEAARLGTFVHLRVQPKAAGKDACYIIFSDTYADAALRNFSTPCDCTLPAGSRCPSSGSSPTTRELKTVTLAAFTGLDLAAINLSQVGFDPVTGMMLARTYDLMPAPKEFIVDTLLDSPRRLQLQVGFTGRVRVCAPAGSTIKATAC
ncbi:MAG: prepilin-type N-terminal cleavage/methylation domain-containing protein [Rubrivivax sp.]|nr:prepilin-type N-terminal cleavage/methylation domain-containing protein [Rubrivivax sp.]